MIHKSECREINKKEEIMKVTELKMLKWMCGTTRLYRIRNGCIRRIYMCHKLGRKNTIENRLKRFGRVEKEIIVEKLGEIRVDGNRRKAKEEGVGRVIKEDMRTCGIDEVMGGG